MAIISISALKNLFQQGDAPTGSNFTDLIDTTYNFPNSAAPVSTNLTLTQTTSGIPVLVNGETYYLPIFKSN